jgi:hypothetical protein
MTSWEATSCSASQNISSLLYSRKFHYYVYMTQPVDPTLTQIHSVHVLKPYFILSIVITIIPSTLRSPKLCVTFRLFDSDGLCDCIVIRDTCVQVVFLCLINLTVCGKECKLCNFFFGLNSILSFPVLLFRQTIWFVTHCEIIYTIHY